MIDFTTATSYLKQCVDQLESEHAQIASDKLLIEADKKKVLLERSELIAQKSSFFEQTKAMTAQVERAEKLHGLATKMKAQVDEDRTELAVKDAALKKREVKVVGLEAEKADLEKLKLKLKTWEAELEDREVVVLKDKQAARSKQEDLEIKEKHLLKQQQKLERMIEAQA